MAVVKEGVSEPRGRKLIGFETAGEIHAQLIFQFLQCVKGPSYWDIYASGETGVKHDSRVHSRIVSIPRAWAAFRFLDHN